MQDVNTSSKGWLDRWYDPGLDLPKKLDEATIVEGERERISLAIATVLYASTIPRRLGGDADNEELAVDKKRCRRVAHALRQAYRGWDKKPPALPDSDEIKQAGAQLLWVEFQAVHITTLGSRLALAATFAIRSNAGAWGRHAVTNYENERHWFTYALRD